MTVKLISMGQVMNKINTLFFLISFLFVANISAKDFDAVLVWPDKQVMAFPVTGVVDEVLVQPGDKVTKNQKMAMLDLVPFQTQIKLFQAKVDRITPLLFNAKRDYDQAQELFERTVLSEVELQKSESIYKGLKAELDQANAELTITNWRYAHAQLIAPFEGRIIQRSLQKGDVVSDETMSRMMIVLVSSTLMQAMFSTDAELAVQYQTGQKASVEVASRLYPAIVKSITSDDGKQYQIRLEFTLSQDYVLVAGQKAKATL